MLYDNYVFSFVDTSLIVTYMLVAAITYGFAMNMQLQKERSLSS